MPRASKFKFPEEKLQEIIEHFTQLISSLSRSKEIENFFDNFFTGEEKIMLAKRLVLLMMIKKGYGPTQIQSALHISYETVRIYTQQLQLKNEMYLKTIEKLLDREKSKEFWEKVDKILKPFELAMKARNDMKARAKFASGDWS